MPNLPLRHVKDLSCFGWVAEDIFSFEWKAADAAMAGNCHESNTTIFETVNGEFSLS